MVYKKVQRFAVILLLKVVIINAFFQYFWDNFVSITFSYTIMRNTLITSLFILLLTISCGTAKSTMPAERLRSTTWELFSLYGNSVSPEIYSRGLPYITFGADNRVTGSSGCNSFSAPYNINDEGGIKAGPIMATKMFCEGIDEKSFFEALDKATSVNVKDDKLVLMDGSNNILVFVPKK